MAISLDSSTASERSKRAAAMAAVRYVENGMLIGLGTGSTAAYMIAALGVRIQRQGLTIRAVATSRATRLLAAQAGIVLTTLDAKRPLDLTLDGADQYTKAGILLKGGGGALLFEKIVAQHSHRVIIMAQSEKRVSVLGGFPVPVEIVRFGARATITHIETMIADLGLADLGIANARGLQLRTHTHAHTRAGGTEKAIPITTDGDHYIVDIPMQTIPAPQKLAQALNTIPGVVENGIFVDLCSKVIEGHSDGTTNSLDTPC